MFYKGSMQNSMKTFLVLGILVGMSVFAYLTVRFANYVATKEQDLEIRAGSQDISISFSPATIKQAKDSSFFVLPQVVSGGDKKISTILLRLNFDKEFLEFKGIDGEIADNKMILLKQSSIGDANGSGIVKLLYGADNIDQAPGAIVLSRINFKIKKDGRGIITIDSGISEVVFTSEDKGELKELGSVEIDTNIVQPTLSETPIIPSPTIVVSPTPELSRPPEISPTIVYPTAIPTQTLPSPQPSLGI